MGVLMGNKQYDELVNELADLQRDYAKLLQDNARLVELLREAEKALKAYYKAYNEHSFRTEKIINDLAKELGDD